jgi:hypothetical protein
VRISELSSLAMRTATVLPLLAALSACATAGTARSVGPVGERESVVDLGPRAQIWTTDEFGSGNRIRTSFRLEDDAYVIVVNVGLDGYANVVFPESPEDDGFVRGGRIYRLPSFFPGFASHFSSSYGRLYNATSAYDDIYDRYAGYVFIIASWRPMHFQVTEAMGLWDEYRLAAHEQRLDPYVVMHRFADRLVGGRARDYTARFARYAAFSGGFARARSFASCSLYGPVLGYFPSWAFYTASNWWMPIFGLGYYGSRPGCGYGYGITFASSRPRVRPIVVTPPVRPAPPPGTGDTAAKPRGARPPRHPRSDPDGGKRKTGMPARVADEETVIDLTRETRAQARWRDRDAGWARRALRDERGRTPADHGRADRDGAWTRERPRAHRDDGARNDRARSEPRTSEPRREPARWSEPRAAPRQDPRPQPATRSDPPPRSEPASRSEPRSERPAKPDRH